MISEAAGRLQLPRVQIDSMIAAELISMVCNQHVLFSARVE